MANDKTETKEKEKISYDFLVLATGANFSFPIKEPDDSSVTIKERYTNINKIAEEI